MEFNLLIKKTYMETLQQTCGSKNWSIRTMAVSELGLCCPGIIDIQLIVFSFSCFFLKRIKGVHFFGSKTKRKQNGDCVNDGRNSAGAKITCQSCVKNFLSNGWTIIFSEEVRQFSEVYFFHCQDWKNCFRFVNMFFLPELALHFSSSSTSKIKLMVHY